VIQRRPLLGFRQLIDPKAFTDGERAVVNGIDQLRDSARARQLLSDGYGICVSLLTKNGPVGNAYRTIGFILLGVSSSGRTGLHFDVRAQHLSDETLAYCLRCAIPGGLQGREQPLVFIAGGKIGEVLLRHQWRTAGVFTGSGVRR